MSNSDIPLKSVSTQFAAVAAARPEVPAIVDRDRTFTYAELDRRAELLAAELIRRGVNIEDSVGLLLDRSMELCLGMLAAHKCGGCYVPLDPAWPENRHLFIAQDTACKILLSVSDRTIPPELLEKTLFIDRLDWSAIPPAEDFPPPDLNRLAYILYTSGSTGVPKGVEIEHAGLANFVAWQNGVFPHAKLHRTTQAARPGFDASGSEIWPALCSGSTIYIIPDELLLNPPALAKWLADNLIAECFLPTPLAELLMDNGMPPGSALRILRVGGDRLTRKPPADFPAMLVNEYGPTECSIVSTYSIFFPGDSPEPPPDIGFPLGRLNVRIMDDNLQPLPDGQAGEICIGGIGLARGYHNRPDLDALAFAADPADPAKRIYRTGDIGIRQCDGRFEFIGRRDFQVKIRGLRIELGEIEEVIASHKNVAKCVAVVRDSTSGAKYIASYVTLHKPAPGIENELLESARSSLPEYMVPSALRILDAFPLTANGKIDRAALPEPEASKNQWLPPATPCEKKLAAMWQEQLTCPPPGLKDNFFRLGGDSLQAAMLAVRIGDEFNFDSPASLLFEHPELDELAGFVGRQAGTGASRGLTHGGDETARTCFPATSYQTAQWKLQKFSGTSNLNNIVLTVHLEGEVDPALLRRVLEGITADHQSLRSRFCLEGRQLWQQVTAEVPVELTFHDWSGESPERIEELFALKIDEHRAHEFQLNTPPLFRAELFRFGPRHSELLFTVCHLVFDGWSGALFLSRLRDDYLRLSAGREPERPAADAPDYSDFANRHRQLLESGHFDKGLEVWRDMLDQLKPMPELPFERNEPEGDRNSAGRYEFTIPENLCSRLRNYALEAGTTLFTLLQAVLHLQLHKYTGVTDIVTGTAFANRKLKNSEGIIGMFINSLPLRHRLNPDEDFDVFVRGFARTVKLCVAHGDVPLDMIMEQCGLSGRDTPLFPVSLLLQNLPWPENGAEALRIGYDELGSGVAKTDLTLVMEERQGALDCHVEYRESQFTRKSVASFCDAFADFAATLIENSGAPIASLHCPSVAGARPGTYIVGDTGLVPACGDILRRNGFHILGVFSGDTPAIKWAQQHRIPCHNPSAAVLRDKLRLTRFDYLFSIINSLLLDKDILSMPRKAAINYHDSPLPRYAGLNASCHAVINREPAHGVTWHLIADGIDTGDICIQRKFELSPENTAVQLSLKCSEAGVATLAELAPELIAGRLKPRPQDLSQRSCYGGADRPYAGAMLDWTRGPEELCALVRGLDLGAYNSEMACAKFMYGGKIVIAGTAETADAAFSQSDFDPGIVLGADDDAITVSAGSGLIRLGDLRDASGSRLNPRSIPVGDRLEYPEEFDFATLDRVYRAAARNEKFWAGILAELETPDIPLHGWEKLPTGAQRRFALKETEGFDSAAVFALFMTRLCAAERVHLPVRFSGEPFGKLPPDFLLEYLPLRAEADFDREAAENLKGIAAMLSKLAERRACPGDICLRRKNLSWFSSVSPALEIDESGKAYLLDCEDERAGRLIELFNAFLENLAQTPNAPLKAIRLQTAREFHREVFDWNHNSRNYRLNTSYAGLFAERLRKHPDRTAVSATGGSMSYSELDAYSSRIAHILAAHGAVHGDTIGIYAARSIELAGALLGIFKAGCAYLALEPGQFPAERRNTMLETGEAKILLYFDHAVPPPEFPAWLDVIDLAAEREVIAAFSDSFEAPECDGSETAYIMFTSGSTGTPKGVMISQRNLLNHNQAVIDAFGLGPEDRVLQFGSLSFDLSVEELFPVLLAGGTLVFRPGRVPPSPAELLDFARSERISVFDLPTAYWHGMVRSLRAEDVPPSLRLVVIGGEHASEEHLKHWRELAPGVRLLNTYGPTETTVIATASEDFSTIGRPIANTACYILDRFMQPCPPGCPGEIFIGGEGVAKGYINDPLRTARVFMPDPFVPGGRIYRSGDLGCHARHGEIIYLGRADRQIKIRGFRIEPEGVEDALRQLTGIDDAVVAVNRDPHTGTYCLDGYVTIKSAGIDPTHIREQLAGVLPEFMVPATITIMAELPVTPTGKIDRQALPPPRRKEAAKSEYQPDSTLEMQISLIFRRLLGREAVDPEQSFFNLGGDSLSALSLCLEVERVCGCKLGMEEFYRNPSIKGLTEALGEQRCSAAAWSPLVLLADNGKQRPLYLLHTTPGDVLGYVNLAGRLENRRIYAFQACGLNCGNQPHRTIPEMAACYVRLLREHQPRGPYYLCGWCFGGILAYEMACQLKEHGEEVGFLGLIETWGRPPMSLPYLFRLGRDFLRWGPKGWMAYLMTKFGGDQRFRQQRENLDFIASRFSGSREQGEVEHLKKIYNINLQAVNNYYMRHYPGEIELFCVDAADLYGIIPSRDRRWTGLVDNMRIDELESGRHDEILKPPAVNEVATRINAALDTADRRNG
ncbi:MAG: amino acid adenylation domain-containing protein [Victivallaceae bacterium]|nr:amino acid adenylation domain-containing protein [Victivallaceae bacterium]